MMAKLVVKLIAAYQYFLSPLLGNRCRFYPSCSRYTQQAISKHGVVLGLMLGTRRIACCHPFHEGGVDPVPDKVSFTLNKQ